MIIVSIIGVLGMVAVGVVFRRPITRVATRILFRSHPAALVRDVTSPARPAAAAPATAARTDSVTPKR